MRCLFSLTALLALALPVQAQERSPLSMEATNLTAVQQDRSASVARVDDIYEFRLIFTNTTDGEVRNVVFDNPVPEALEYIGDSAGAVDSEVRIEFSVDGGSSFSTQPTITVVEDGREVERPAPPDAITDIRWTLLGGVAPQAQVTASFMARVQG